MIVKLAVVTVTNMALSNGFIMHFTIHASFLQYFAVLQYRETLNEMCILWKEKLKINKSKVEI